MPRLSVNTLGRPEDPDGPIQLTVPYRTDGGYTVWVNGWVDDVDELTDDQSASGEDQARALFRGIDRHYRGILAIGDSIAGLHRS